MKGYSGRRARNTALAALFFLPLLCLFPPFAQAQTRAGERVSTGRFGAEEPEDSGTAGERGLNTHWLYLGLRTGPSLRFYTPSDDTPYTGGDTRGFSMDTAFQAGVQVLSFLSIQAEAVFTWDKASLWAYRAGAFNEVDRYTKDYTFFSLRFPLLVKFDFYPGRFKISPFLGLYFLTPLGKLKASNSLNDEELSLSYRISTPIGLLGGLSGAMKLGPGALIADIRYAADLGDLEAREGEIQQFRRGMISFTMGYELGLFAKKRGTP
jgi:hypothetical protein